MVDFDEVEKKLKNATEKEFEVEQLRVQLANSRDVMTVCVDNRSS